MTEPVQPNAPIKEPSQDAAQAVPAEQLSQTTAEMLDLAADAEDTFDLGETFTSQPAEPPAEATAPADEAAAEPEPSKITRTEPNVLQEFDIYGKSETGSPDTLHLPSENAEVVAAVGLTLSGNEKFGETAAEQRWASRVEDGLNYSPLKNQYIERLMAPNAVWRQSLKHNGIDLSPKVASARPEPGITESEGETAMLRMSAWLGIGGTSRVLLMNSGFHVYFKPPEDLDVLELNNIIASEKIKLGRSSWGIAHSADVSYTLARVFDFALRHVYKTSINEKEFQLHELVDLIAPQDVNAFIYGLLLAMYPSGFYYERPCINDPRKCVHVSKGTLSLAKLLVMDNSYLESWQLDHLTNMAAGSMKLSEVKRYQLAIKNRQKRRVVIGAGTRHEMAIHLTTCPLRQYLNQSHSYIETLVDRITRSVADNANLEQRNAAIYEASNATSLCQWSHFIEAIEYGDLTPGEEKAWVTKDPNSVKTLLGRLSSIDSIREEIITQVVKFIDDTTTSLVAIPAYDCPVCHKPQEDHESLKDRFPRMASYIPLDVLQVFFGLIGQRLERIAQR